MARKCNYCEEEEALYYVEYELKCGAIHHDYLCLECLRQVINKEIIKELYFREIHKNE